MKLEVGMYVRTKNNPYIPSEIAQIIKMDDKYIYLDIDKDSNVVWEYPEYIEKASHNIIDLIEVGDYVNGFRVNKIERDKTNTIIKIGNSTFNVLENEEIYTPSNDNNNGYEKIEKLKSIVTKEMFESMSYKVQD